MVLALKRRYFTSAILMNSLIDQLINIYKNLCLVNRLEIRN